MFICAVPRRYGGILVAFLLKVPSFVISFTCCFHKTGKGKKSVWRRLEQNQRKTQTWFKHKSKERLKVPTCGSLTLLHVNTEMSTEGTLRKGAAGAHRRDTIHKVELLWGIQPRGLMNSVTLRLCLLFTELHTGRTQEHTDSCCVCKVKRCDGAGNHRGPRVHICSMGGNGSLTCPSKTPRSR